MTAAADTIAAIATPPGRGAVAIVRCSGAAARTIAARVFNAGGTVLHDRVVTYGTIVGADGRTIDRGLAVAMDAPRSATGETVVELHVHGSPVVARETLHALIAAGARLAAPGEFTRRGYVNGKLDLSAAEAVADLIDAESRAAAHAAAANLTGGLRRAIEGIAGALAGILEELAGAIDFPDEVPEPDARRLHARVDEIARRLNELAADTEIGRLVRDGIAVAIVGPPNAGKSSLLNALVGDDRAIVSPLAGTTRDTVEDACSIDGVRVRVTDTAGLRTTGDALERAGIARARAALAAATLALVVIDGSQAMGGDAAAVLAQTRGRPRIVFYNKRDCGTAAYQARDSAEADALCGSVFDPESVAALRHAIAAIGWGGERIDATRPHLASARQVDAVARAHDAVAAARVTLAAGWSPDLAAGDLAIGLAALREISGGAATEALLDGIFARFCVGK